MKIKTSLLQELVSKSVKGASNNKMIPITGFMGIDVRHDIVSGKAFLNLITTDGNNILKVESVIDETPDFYTVVSAENFSKLVGKITVEYIELILKENYLIVEGNGTYKLDIPVDSEGNIVKFDDIPQVPEKECDIEVSKLQSYIEAAKVAVANTMDSYLLTGYYIDKAIITTNSEKLCYINEDIGIKSPMLLSAPTAELLLVFTGEKLTLSRRMDDLLFEGNGVTLYCKELPEKDKYPISTVNSLLDMSLTSSIKLSKDKLLNALDRMSLFVDEYDENGIHLAFTKEALFVKSQKSNGQELIDGISNREEEFDCIINIEMLTSAIKAVTGEQVEILYGLPTAIQIKDNNTTLLLSLMSEEN